MAKQTEIILGDQTFKVGMLPIGVLRELDTEVTDTPADTLSAREKEAFFFDQGVKIIVAGLKTVDAKWTTEAVLALPVSSVSELWEARRKILVHSGLITDAKVTKPGEGSAGTS